MSEKRCYTVQELQEILGVSRPTIYNLLKKKEFRWIQLDDGKYRISKKSFDDWLDKLGTVKNRVFMIYSRKIKWKLLLSITGNEYQKTLFGTGIKASPGIGQRKTEKRTLFWKMQQLRWNKEIWKGVCNNMASIRERNGKFNVIYSYTNEKGERKQKWEIYETKAEAKRRKKKTGRFLRMKEMSLLSTTIFFRSLVMQSCQRLIPDSLKDIIRVF